MCVLTRYQKDFCHIACRNGKRDSEMERAESKNKIWVYLNKNMLDLAKSQKVIPYQFSYFIFSGHELVGVAEFELSELESIGDHETNAYDAWWREIGRLNTSFESLGEKPHRPIVMRREGILSYLCDEYGLSTERNVACAIGEMMHEEGLFTPLALINSL